MDQKAKAVLPIFQLIETDYIIGCYSFMLVVVVS